MSRGRTRLSRGRTGPILLVALGCVAALLTAGPASAGAPRAVTDYCQGHCNDVLPPGENGNATLADILANRTLGTRPAHTADQLGKYGDLATGYRELTDDTIGRYFNDSSLGVPADQVASSISPRSDVTIVRDRATGVPHVYGTTRSGTEFGAGYAAGQDRLWLMDLFRHVGRGELTGFAGGAPANRALEQAFWRQAPYSEQDLQDQVDRVAASGSRGAQAYQDVKSYVDGVNAYIDAVYPARTFPGEYDLTGHVDPVTNAGGIDHFRPTDLVAIASVIGALFGAGGGGEVGNALVKQAFDAKYGVAEGDRLWQAFREQNDPEAVLTVHDGHTFPYGGAGADAPSVAMPDPGSVTPQPIVVDPTGSAGSSATAARKSVPGRLGAAAGMFNHGVLPADLLDSPKRGMSNALVVSAAHSAGGHPVAVFGPQTGYYAPQLLMLEELEGPGISARGAAFAGLSFYVQLGRGADYSWSATSAGQDITDTYAVPLCNADGSAPTKDSLSYEYHGSCLPMQKLERDDAWTPTLADQTPAGSYKLVMYRTKYGLVQSRATVGGKPVVFTSLRSSYLREVDSIVGFQEFNDPDAIRSASDFQHAAADVNYTFNWFYVDSRDTAYFNSGDNPVRPADVDFDLPVKAQQRYEWQGWNPDDNSATYTPFAAHPQSVNQDYYVSWNNKQALDYGTAGPGDGPVHRVNLLDDRVRTLVHSGQPVTRADLTRAMADAANTDLRGEDVLPLALKVIGSAPVTDPDLAKVVNALKSWQAAGSHRLPAKAGDKSYVDADTIRVLDAWWPLLVHAEFAPGMGDDLYQAQTGTLQLNDSPSGGQNGGTGGGDVNESQSHKGSSFQYGWWSYSSKDLRTVLGEPVSAPLGRAYCGGGELSACRTALLDSLRQAAAEPADQVYPGDADCDAGDQWCADSIVQHPLGGITDPTIGWQNRPTFQQVVQYQAHR
ncbi:penicillin acylase family protein [Actinocatenispora rupis]|uniref:Penicillin acylase n=1 Tax=Actinocatenispora rupis TaxID=519421 RepID=A0A8J3J7G4_9ACTN|nr:penicillin acylase family protein [Actinocatenispora rupis]GID13036.1 penicillin acylase [Actinocatenispora rupis]